MALASSPDNLSHRALLSLNYNVYDWNFKLLLMLNEQKANQILGTAFGPLTIKDIHWRSQDSDKSSILFYKIAEDEKSRSLFTERIAEANFGCLVVNIEIDSLPKNAVVIPEAKWPEVQKQILDELYPLPAIKL